MVSKRLYIGNVSFNATTDDLRSFFQGFDLVDVKIITDRETGRPRGFAFVELKNPNDMEKAISSLDGTEHMGRTLRVSEANEKPNARAPRRDDRNQGHNW